MSAKKKSMLAIASLLLPMVLSVGSVSATPLSTTRSTTPASDVIPLANVETVFEVKGMHCPACPVTVRLAAKKVPGVIDARVSVEQARAWVTYDPAQTSPEVIAAAITKAGYPATPLP